MDGEERKGGSVGREKQLRQIDKKIIGLVYCFLFVALVTIIVAGSEIEEHGSFPLLVLYREPQH